ncbi:meiosis-specific protein MEI4 [Pelodytes ibericus]
METPTWYQMTTKLALALAIIRSKPEGKSSREYLAQLTVSAQDVNYKTKVTELEAEVLNLRQQLLLSKIKPNTSLVQERNVLESEQLDHLGEPMSQLENDSGCDFSNEETMNTLTGPHISKCEQPGNSLSHFTSISKSHPILELYPATENQLLIQMQFLHHLLGLGKLTTSGSFLTDLTKLGNECNVIADSVSGLLNGLLSLYRKPKPSVSTIQTEAVGTITRLFTNSCLPTNAFKKCIKNLEDFEESLIQSILSNNNINRFQVQQSMAHCLSLLGKCRVIRGPLINLLISQVKRFVDELLQPRLNTHTKYDITQYENIFSLCSVLEDILHCIKQGHEISHSEPFQEETKLFMQSLDQTILLLADEFPLFCLYLWRLGTLFSYIDQMKTEDLHIDLTSKI